MGFEKPPIQPDAEKDLPGGAMPEHMLWEPRMRGDKEVGVRDPEGNYYELRDGEKFSIEKDRENKTYEAVITSTGGERRVLKQGIIEGVEVDHLDISDRDKKDIEYSQRFWEGKPAGLRERMQEEIKKNVKDGFISIALGGDKLTERDK